MGKAKKRTMCRTSSDFYLTRETAANRVSEIINRSIMKENDKVPNLITLFGLSAEELSEAGVPYENLVALSGYMH